jgi:type III secretory pathway component EscV
MTVPVAGLLPSECLVDGTVDRLIRLEVKGRAAINPVHSYECAIIDAKSKKVVEDAGLKTWSAIDYVVLALAAMLQQRSAYFLDRSAATNHLENLAQAFPELIRAARAKYSNEQITRVLRDLVAEQISIRNLRLILEELLDFDYVVTDASKLIVFDDRLPTDTQPASGWTVDSRTLAAFVRMHMKR